MSLSIISDVWEALREHIDLNDRKDAADTLINLLIDNDFEVDDIKSEFKDKDITTALKDYAEEHFPVDEYEEEFDDEDDDTDNWD